MSDTESTGGHPTGISRRALVGAVAADIAGPGDLGIRTAARRGIARIQSIAPYGGTTRALLARGECPPVSRSRESPRRFRRYPDTITGAGNSNVRTPADARVESVADHDLQDQSVQISTAAFKFTKR